MTRLGELLQRVSARLRRTPSLGTRGEIHAARYLKKQGYRIITRNRRHKKGEIDIIAMNTEFLVFVEVRTRATEDFMTPVASLRKDKRDMVRKTARRLIRKHKTAGLIPRIDVIAIIWPNGTREPTELRHHKGVIPLTG